MSDISMIRTIWCMGKIGILAGPWRRHHSNLVWNTPEGLAVKALYTRQDIDDLAYVDTLPASTPSARPAADHVCS